MCEGFLNILKVAMIPNLNHEFVYILSQSSNTTLFYFDIIFFLMNALGWLVHLN